MKQTLSIRIPDDLRDELERISKSESKPVSDLVRESIRHYVAIYTFGRLRKIILPYAEAQGIIIDEDVFNSVSLK